MPRILYKVDGSPPARAVMMVADILGVNYDTCEINPVLREQDTPEMVKNFFNFTGLVGEQSAQPEFTWVGLDAPRPKGVSSENLGLGRGRDYRGRKSWQCSAQGGTRVFVAPGGELNFRHKKTALYSTSTNKNPMRTVPTLEEDGFCLADSHAIMIYLCEKYGTQKHEKLYPKDERKRATINQRLFFDCGVLFPRLRSVMAPTYGGRLTELSKSMITNIEDAYKILEMYLDSKFLAGDDVTLADISIITTIASLNGLHPITEQKYPKLKQWFITMSQMEFCKRINEPGALEHIAGLKAMMVHNKERKTSKL